jgi:predicted RNase H-like HicB family nuclease
MRYAVVIEAAGDNCVASGSTPAETKAALRGAIEFHLEGMREDGTPIPPPSSRVEHPT